MTDSEAKLLFALVGFTGVFVLVWIIESLELRKSVIVRGSKIE